MGLGSVELGGEFFGGLGVGVCDGGDLAAVEVMGEAFGVAMANGAGSEDSYFYHNGMGNYG